jgi:flagellar motility protein MotE (MotC chaperone)
MNPRSQRKSHVLLTLGVLFTLGGVTRLLPDLSANAESPVTADAAPETAAEADAQATTKAAEEKKPAQVPVQEVCFTGETAALLSQDEWLFEPGDESLKDQKLALQVWEAELEKQTAELKAIQQTLDARWNEMQKSADEDIEHLAAMYATMKPDQAAAIFNQMDPGFAAGFLRLLPSDQAGLILAGMQTEKAYVVSVKLASMNDDLQALPEAPAL